MQNQGQPSHHERSRRRGATRSAPPDEVPAESPAESRDDELKAEIQDDSDKLLRAVDEIRALESEKRHLVMSTPEFHQIAARIERKAREVFGLAKAQREVGEALRAPEGETTIDSQARKEGDES